MKRLLLVFVLFLIACSSTIDRTVKPGNEGYVVGNGSIGVLLTHGLSSSPHEEQYLADYLAARNMTVVVVLLPGHGTSPADLATTTWQEWYNSYRDAYISLKSSKQDVFVGGMSLGGSLALKLAEDENVTGIIALAPALKLTDNLAQYAWFFRYFVKYSARNISAADLPYNYDVFPVASVDEMNKLSDVVQKNISEIHEPILLMQYTDDYRVNTISSKIVYNGVNSSVKKLVWVNGTGHVMIQGADSNYSSEQIYEFIESQVK